MTWLNSSLQRRKSNLIRLLDLFIIDVTVRRSRWKMSRSTITRLLLLLMIFNLCISLHITWSNRSAHRLFWFMYSFSFISSSLLSSSFSSLFNLWILFLKVKSVVSSFTYKVLASQVLYDVKTIVITVIKLFASRESMKFFRSLQETSSI